MGDQYVIRFDQIRLEDVSMVGGKNASLGEMIQTLTKKGVNVPPGFATTSYAYRQFIEGTGLITKLRHELERLNVENVVELRNKGQKVRQLIMETPFNSDFEEAILKSYVELCESCGYEVGEGGACDCDVAVRSSATAEDLPDASFAGQQETYLNVRGARQVVDSVHRCFASLFTDRAISYRTIHKFDHLEVSLSVGVQRMVRSDLACSGVIFSLDTETGFKDVVLLTAAYGLGENIVQGTVNPDEYFVFKPTLKNHNVPIIQKRLGSKEFQMVYGTGGSLATRNIPVSMPMRRRFVLKDSEIIQLAKWTCIIEDHYSQLRGSWTPMDIEWAKDGVTGQLFIVQARPETVHSTKPMNILRKYKLEESSIVLAAGRAVGEMIGQGRANVILKVENISMFKEGEVLITNRTDPDWEPIMKKATAIVTNQGGRTCHAAIIARELGIPAIVGCCDATHSVHTGQEVTVVCSEGEEGKVYSGLLKYQVAETKLETLPKTNTDILVNIGNPEEAFSLSFLPCNGVGLARLEFIIVNWIKVHPLALIHYDRLKDVHAKTEIGRLTELYEHKPDYFVDKLASGIATIAAAFFPRPVVVRMSDFKTNEYASLLGGKQFEPPEENPMIGWRGASRYYDPNYREGFALECKAMKHVIDEMGLNNVIPMIPFCRTPQEGQRVLQEMERHGLCRGHNHLKVYVMCEIPSNVILAEQFSKLFDGFSIGSNDLTQLTLGLDRDSSLVAHLFDERNDAVKRMVKSVIEVCRSHGVKIGICGQAPSDYPEFAQFLVQCGINSISLNADSILKTILSVAEMEAATKTT